jgi:hypothetical protein
MKTSSLLLALLIAPLSPAALAATVACPDLATAVQVGACPAEEELKYTFTGYCSDDGKSYKGETGICSDYQKYRTLKNVALWESGDALFNAYVSCDLPPASVKAAKASGVRVARQGKMTLLVCSYGEGVNFTWRSRVECQVDGAAACTGAACKATCD